jgi:hypothetical protein
MMPWSAPWRAWAGHSRAATREFARSAAAAEKPAPELNLPCNSRRGPADRRKEDAFNKRRPGERAPKAPGQTDDVLAARAINAQPWEPPPSMAKKAMAVVAFGCAVTWLRP